MDSSTEANSKTENLKCRKAKVALTRRRGEAEVKQSKTVEKIPFPSPRLRVSAWFALCVFLWFAALEKGSPLAGLWHKFPVGINQINTK